MYLERNNLNVSHIFFFFFLHLRMKIIQYEFLKAQLVNGMIEFSLGRVVW